MKFFNNHNIVSYKINTINITTYFTYLLHPFLNTIHHVPNRTIKYIEIN